MPDILYHLTLSRNVPSILRCGLLINQPSVMTRLDDVMNKIKIYGVNPIYLSENPVRLARQQLGWKWLKDNSSAIIVVSSRGLSLVDEYAHLPWYKNNGYTWVSLQNIPATNIVELNWLS